MNNHRLGGLHSNHLFSTVLEAKIKIKVLRRSGDQLVRTHFLVYSQPIIFWLCPHVEKGSRELFGVSDKGTRGFPSGSVVKNLLAMQELQKM